VTDLHFLWLCWGPVLLCFSAGWLVRHPDEWTGPAIIIPISLAYGAMTYTLAFRRLRTSIGSNKLDLIAAMIAGPLVGIVLAVMLVTGVIG
jgi:hypothetical protein